MKKTLFVLTALACASVAQAQAVPDLLGGPPVAVSRTPAARPAAAPTVAAPAPVVASVAEKAAPARQPATALKSKLKAPKAPKTPPVPTVAEVATAPAKVEPVLADSRAWQGKATPTLSPVTQNGVTRFPYGEGTPVIHCAPIRACTIEMEPGEDLQHWVLGESNRWSFDRKIRTLENGVEQDIVVVRPTEPGLKTNLQLMTNRRMYEINLVASEGDYLGRSGFYYPLALSGSFRPRAKGGEAAAGAEAATTNERRAARLAEDKLALPAIDKLDFGYAFSGPSEISPVRVFTDGSRTFFQMPASMQTLPLLTIRSVDGEAAVANYSSVYGANGDLYWIVGKVVEFAEISVGQGASRLRVEVERKKGAR